MVKYQSMLEASWVWKEMREVRNFAPSFHVCLRVKRCWGHVTGRAQRGGLIGGILYSGLSGLILRGREPWTFHNSTADRDAVC